MGPLGTLALYAAVASILVMLGAGVQAARLGSVRLARMTENATLALAASVTLAVLALQIALVSLDFRLTYVGEYTSRTLSVPYRIGSMWAGQGGSLLLWAWIIALGGAFTVLGNRRRGLGLSPWVFVILGLCASLFVVLTTFLQSPFVAASQEIINGAGLNPLLQDPLQLIHPLFLYSGYVLITVPFAVVLGSVIGGQVSGPWVSYARVWSVIAWTSLSIGMLLGARWAYAELGWGGYWAWDPVENASLIPWLAGTALVHTGLAHRDDRQRVRTSSVVLLATVFNLCLFGTFLTRSGVIQSVHAFGISNLGPVLGAAIVVSVIGSAAVVVWRLPSLQHVDAKRRAHGWLGQAILVTLLIAMTTAVLWGTLYPLFARAFQGREVAVTPGFFKAVVTPMGIGLLVLLAVSPLLRSQRVPDVRREAVVRAALLIVVGGAALALGTTMLVAFVLAISLLALKTIMLRTRPMLGAAIRTQRDTPRAIGRALAPYLAHVGLVVLLAAITINVTGEVKQQAKLFVGKSTVLAGQHIRLDGAQLEKFPDRQSIVARMSLLDSAGGVVSPVVASVDAFPNSDQPHVAVGIVSSISRDVYVVIDGWPTNPANGITWMRISVYDNPAINWVWFGGGLIGLAGILYALTLLPRREQVVLGDVDAAVSAELTPSRRRKPMLVAVALIAAVGVSGYALSNRGEAPAVAEAGAVSNVDQAAVAALMVRLTKDANDVDAYRQLGALYFNAGGNAANGGNDTVAAADFAKSSIFFAKRAALAPADITSWLDAGAAALAAKDLSSAFTDLGRALKIDPNSQLAHFDLAIAYLNDSPAQPDKARAEFQKVVQINPNSNMGKAAAQRIGSATKLTPGK